MLRCGDWAAGHESFAGRVDDEVQAFQGVDTKESGVALFCEDDLVDRKVFIHPDDGKADAPRYHLAVGHDEREVLLFLGHADPLRRGRRESGVLAPRIDKDLGDPCKAEAVDVVFDLAAYVKSAHRSAPLACGAH